MYIFIDNDGLIVNLYIFIVMLWFINVIFFLKILVVYLIDKRKLEKKVVW